MLSLESYLAIVVPNVLGVKSWFEALLVVPSFRSDPWQQIFFFSASFLLLSKVGDWLTKIIFWSRRMVPDKVDNNRS